MSKRKNYLSWEAYYMTVAQASSMRSKDPSTQVGAVLVNRLKQIVATGYNGFVRGIDDDTLPWGKEGEWLDTKYPYVAHAELNAIASARTDLSDCELYVTLFPCNECTKVVIQAGIKKIYYISDKHNKKPLMIASKKMLDLAGIEYIQLDNLQIDINVKEA